MKPFDIPRIAPNHTGIGFGCGFLQDYLKTKDPYALYFFRQLHTIHRVDFFIWLICLDGQTVHMLDCKKIILAKGQAMLIRPNQVHQVLDLKNSNGFFVVWREEFLLNSVDLDNVPSVQFFNQKDSDELKSFGQLLKTGKEFAQLSLKILFLQNQLTAFLYYLTQKFNKPTNQKSQAENRFNAFNRLLEKHFLNQKQVQFYAKTLNCSPKTLNVACQSQTGKSVKTLIERRVFLESKRLLVHSKLSINAIAGHLGFIDGTQFAKFFKKHEQKTANEFRQNFKYNLNSHKKS